MADLRWLALSVQERPWGSPLLGSVAGSPAWWHGTDPLWLLQASSAYPEPFPSTLAQVAYAYYDRMSAQAVETPESRQPSPVAPRGWSWCIFRCRMNHPLSPRAAAECMMRECGLTPKEVQPAIEQEGLSPRVLTAYVVGIGLVLIGAWALVRG
jgi:hypothetical protein